jgi:hypothetical protein
MNNNETVIQSIINRMSKYLHSVSITYGYSKCIKFGSLIPRREEYTYTSQQEPVKTLLYGVQI